MARPCCLTDIAEQAASRQPRTGASSVDCVFFSLGALWFQTAWHLTTPLWHHDDSRGATFSSEGGSDGSEPNLPGACVHKWQGAMQVIGRCGSRSGAAFERWLLPGGSVPIESCAPPLSRVARTSRRQINAQYCKPLPDDRLRARVRRGTGFISRNADSSHQGVGRVLDNNVDDSLAGHHHDAASHRPRTSPTCRAPHRRNNGRGFAGRSLDASRKPAAGTLTAPHGCVFITAGDTTSAEGDSPCAALHFPAVAAGFSLRRAARRLKPAATAGQPQPDHESGSGSRDYRARNLLSSLRRAATGRRRTGPSIGEVSGV